MCIRDRSTTAFASPPQVGDNTVFECREISTGFGCIGDLVHIFNPLNQKVIQDVPRSLRRANRITRRYIRKINTRIENARARGRRKVVSNLRATRRSVNQSRRDFDECNDYRNLNCEVNSSDAASACDVASDPSITQSRSSRSRNFDVHSRIVNGDRCFDTQNSPVVRVLFNEEEWCTGTLIDTNVVLTAEHCIPNSDCSQKLTIETASGDSFFVNRCISHEGAGSGEIAKNDIALLELEGQVEGITCLLYTSPSPRDATLSRMPSSA